MAFDIRGGIKNTDISSNKYVVIEELLSNAIDSYLIRRNMEDSLPPMEISFELDFFQRGLLQEDGYDLRVTCLDNGAGFGKEQISAFVTKDTTYKDYLKIEGIGKCKGTGRIQFFHYFEKLSIESIVFEENCFYKKEISVLGENRGVSERDFSSTKIDKRGLITKVVLDNFKLSSTGGNINPTSLRAEYSAKLVYKYLFLAFMQRFIVLRNIIGDFKVSVTERCDDEEETILLSSAELPDHVSKKTLPLICSHNGSNGHTCHTLEVTRYSLPSDLFVNFSHEVALCANSAIVTSIVKKFIRIQKDRQLPIDGKFELLLVESDFLESKVNDQRDGFKIPNDCSNNGDLYGDVSKQDIVESLEDYVFDILTPSDFDRDELLKSTEQRFGISPAMIDQARIKVRYSDTEDNIAKRVLKKFQEEIVNETSNIFNLKQELLQLDPTTEDFREKISKLSWAYTSTIKKMDMANLSQLVVRRSSILEVLRKAVKSILDCQSNNNGKKQNEKIIHNIFFPTGRDSKDCSDHDIWILNEEYHYFEHIASDKPLSSIPWSGGEQLFDGDIDTSLEELFKKNNAEHRLKRPDIAIFNEEGAAIIIEFKAPGVELQEHIPDLIQYSRLLAAKSNGKIKKFYGYLIGDSMDETRMSPSYTKFPSGHGYFNTDRIIDPNTGIQYGELYSEVLFYDQFIERAESRLKIYKEKLNFDD